METVGIGSMRGARSRMWARQKAALALACGLCLLDLLGMLACDSRARAVKAKLSPAQAQLFERGQQLSTECWSCHDFYAENHKIGPHLAAVIGRPAGSLAGFSYSRAMRESGIVWDEGTLRAFLANPARVVPGTTMVARGLGGGEQLDALLFYIEQLSRGE